MTYVSHIVDAIHRFIRKIYVLCTVCDITCQSHNSFKQHIDGFKHVRNVTRFLIKNENKFCCKICKEKFTNTDQDRGAKGYLKHLQSDEHLIAIDTFKHGNKFCCTACGITFNSATQMEQHSISHRHLNQMAFCQKVVDENLFLISESKMRNSRQRRSRGKSTEELMSAVLCIPYQRLLTTHEVNKDMSIVNILRFQQSTFMKMADEHFNKIIQYLLNGNPNCNIDADRQSVYYTLEQNINTGLFQHFQCQKLKNTLNTIQPNPFTNRLTQKINDSLNKTQIITHRKLAKSRNLGNLQCIFCRQALKFNGCVKMVPFLCDYCSDGNNFCHLYELSTVGIHRSLAICPGCLLRPEWKTSSNNPSRQVEHYNLMIEDQTYCVTSVNFDQRNPTTIWMDNMLITKRFTVELNRNPTQTKIPVQTNIYTVCYPNENVISIPVQKYIDLFFEEFGPSIKLANNNQYINYRRGVDQARFAISDIGHIKYNGFLHLLDPVHKLFPHLEQVMREYRKYWTKLNCEITDEGGFGQFCEAIYCNKTSKILSIGSSYKGYKGCYGLITNTDKTKRKSLIDSNKHNFEFYFNSKQVRKLRKGYKVVNEREKERQNKRAVYLPHPKNNKNNHHKVVKVPQVKHYLTINYPELLNAITEIKFTVTLLMYMIGKTVPVLSFMYELIKDCGPTGDWFGNVDLLNYAVKHIVASHVDAVGLIDTKLELRKLVYAIMKTDIDTEDTSILCNESNILNCHSVGQPRYNGHFELKSGSVYFMFSRGLYGGVSHAIHGVDQGTGRVQHGHTKETNTIVLRPLT